MSRPTPSAAAPAPQVYGFLCQNTNVFYAFESYETYAEFLEWLQAEHARPSAAVPCGDSLPAAPAPTADEQALEAELATDEIMRVFEDPLFLGMEEEVELREVDF